MDQKAMYQLTYGLFVLSAKDKKDNGCIINTAGQVTTSPNRITIAVNKQNYTNDMIQKTGLFNLSVLDQSAPFSLFRQFGFQSGRDTDKMTSGSYTRSENGILYLTEYTSAYLSGKVVETLDLGTHMLYLADVTDAAMISGKEPVTYSYYQKKIKPVQEQKKKTGWVCRICGYVYEGESLPDDFICPFCKHSADDFYPQA